MTKRSSTKSKPKTMTVADYERLLAKGPSVLYICKASGDFGATFITPNVRDITGHEPGEFLSRASFWIDNVHPEDRDRVLEGLKKALSGDHHLHEYRFRRKDGSWVWVRDELRILRDSVGKPREICGAWYEITSRKQAEESLARLNRELEERVRERTAEFAAEADLRRKSEEDARAALEASPLGVLIHEQGRFLLANQPALAMLKAKEPGQVLGHMVWEFIHPEDIPLVKERYRELNQGSGLVAPAEYRVRRCDGTFFDAEMISRSFPRDGATRVVTAMQDISARKQMQRALEESEEKYRLLFQLESDALFLAGLGEDGTVIDMNEAALELYGYTREEMRRMRIVDFSAEPERTIQSARIPVDSDLHIPLRWHRRKDGSTFPVEITARTFKLNGRGVILGLHRDISERMQREEELIKAQKLESTAVLAGGIAHDFNNLLTGILGNISLARHKAGDGPVRERLAGAEDAALRAKALSNQLLTFSRGGAPVKKVFSLRRCAQEAALFCTHGSRAACRFELPDDLWPVTADEGQLAQVVQNIVLNAVDAMPEGGTVTLRGENRRLDVGNPFLLPPGPYAVIRIGDSGCGIPFRDLPRIFDPYFSTKREGRGLGLAICHSIVIRHGGRIEVRSKPGEGSEFEVLLPASPGAEPEERLPAPGTDPGARKVLVMDDEEMIRDLTAEMLESLGCRAVTAPDGESAFALYSEARREGDPFDLVIMDLTIPGGIGGKEAMARFREEDPGVLAVVTSGYSNDPVMADFARHGFAGVLVKPFRFEDLRELLARI